MQLFSPQELQALLGLLNRTPMSPAEQLFAQGFFQRLVAFCQPPKPEPEPEPEPKPGPRAESEDPEADLTYPHRITEEESREMAKGRACGEKADA